MGNLILEELIVGRTIIFAFQNGLCLAVLKELQQFTVNSSASENGIKVMEF